MGSRLGYDRKSPVSSYSRWPELGARRAIFRPNSQASSAAAGSLARSGRSSRPPASSASLGRGEPGRAGSPFEQQPTLLGDSPTAPGGSSSPRFGMAPSWRTPWSRLSTSETRLGPDRRRSSPRTYGRSGCFSLSITANTFSAKPLSSWPTSFALRRTCG